jgi:hypothetical protein
MRSNQDIHDNPILSCILSLEMFARVGVSLGKTKNRERTNELLLRTFQCSNPSLHIDFAFPLILCFVTAALPFSSIDFFVVAIFLLLNLYDSSDWRENAINGHFTE